MSVEIKYEADDCPIISAKASCAITHEEQIVVKKYPDRRIHIVHEGREEERVLSVVLQPCDAREFARAILKLADQVES